jgi:hypothetical protein
MRRLLLLPSVGLNELRLKERFSNARHTGCSPLKERYLFDVVADPNQSRDIAAERPEAVAQMEGLYSEWWRGSGCSLRVFDQDHLVIDRRG